MSAALKLNAKLHKSLEVLETKVNALTTNEASLDAFWKRLDFNNNGVVSLAEIDKLCVEQYPLLNKKPALMRAYKRTTGKGDFASIDCALVKRPQIAELIKNLFYFNRVYHVFAKIDSDDDRRIDKNEFKAVFPLLGLDKKKHPVDDVFAAIDANGGGIILFDEFCAWYSENI